MVSLLLLGATVIVAAPADTARPAVLTLEQALEIALSESPTVKIADMEVERVQFARKGTYAALFPEINATGSFNRTLKKQVMTMDFGGVSQSIEVGRWNTVNGGVSASMPLVNAQLWKSLEISGQDVELAVEKARSSRLEMVNQVKQAYFGVLLAKEALGVYQSVYDNAVQNLDLTQKKYNASRASELDLARAKTTVANAVPNLFNAENAIYLSLWQLKAVMGINLDADIDVQDSLLVYSADLQAANFNQDYSIEGNSSLRQLELQAQQLANSIKVQKYANLPSLALAASYTVNAMENELNFSEYDWHPYSYIALSLSIPIFSGGKRLNSIRQSQVQASQLALQKENAERQLHIAIRQSLSTMDTAVKSHESALDALESAQKAYDIAAKSYEVGRSTLTDLDAAQLALTQARLAASQAIYNYLVAKAALESTIGADYTTEPAAK